MGLSSYPRGHKLDHRPARRTHTIDTAELNPTSILGLSYVSRPRTIRTTRFLFLGRLCFPSRCGRDSLRTSALQAGHHAEDPRARVRVPNETRHQGETGPILVTHALFTFASCSFPRTIYHRGFIANHLVCVAQVVMGSCGLIVC